MATVTASIQNYLDNVKAITWPSLGQNDDGSQEPAAHYPDKTVQVAGTFSGATVALEGSNDGTNWFILTDPLGVPVTFTATGLRIIIENPLYVRPKVTGGAGGTDVTVILVATSILI